MYDHFCTILYLLIDLFRKRKDAQLEFMLFQLEIYRSRMKGRAIILSPEERNRMLNLGSQMDHDVSDSLSIVQHNTYKRWLREKEQGSEPKSVGRKSIITPMIKDLIIQMAMENNWGFRRISGELKKLAIDVGYLTVGRIIKEEGVNTPSPHNRKPPPVSWTTFIESHVESIVATDFFTKPIWTLRGKVDAYCLFFITHWNP